MGLFESLKKAIFYNPLAPSHTTPATDKPASTTRVSSTPTAGTASASPTPSSSTPARPAATQPAPAASSPAAAQPPIVDVEAVLTALNAKATQKFNWQTSIVDLMKLVGLDSSLQNRKELAKELGYTGDMNDSAAMNIWLHKAVMQKLAEQGGKVPASLQ
jgi:3-oxoacyl-ACP reductase-like protein